MRLLSRKAKTMNTLPRLNHAALSSELFKKLADVNLTLARRGHVDAALLHLVDIRASQLNGCCPKASATRCMPRCASSSTRRR